MAFPATTTLRSTIKPVCFTARFAQNARRAFAIFGSVRKGIVNNPCPLPEFLKSAPDTCPLSLVPRGWCAFLLTMPKKARQNADVNKTPLLNLTNLVIFMGEFAISP